MTLSYSNAQAPGLLNLTFLLNARSIKQFSSSKKSSTVGILCFEHVAYNLTLKLHSSHGVIVKKIAGHPNKCHSAKSFIRAAIAASLECPKALQCPLILENNDFKVVFFVSFPSRIFFAAVSISLPVT